MLNYIIATYDSNTLEYSLQIQLQILYTLIQAGNNKYISQITIVCPSSRLDKTPHTYYYQKELWLKLFKETTIKLVYLDYFGDNKNASYDQWLQAYLEYPNFEYYIFMEDDYTPHPSIINFDTILVDYYNQTIKEHSNGIGYVCSLAGEMYNFKHHAAISNGIINKKSMNILGETVLEDFYDLVEKQFCQIGFSELFTRQDIPIFSMHNDYKAWFWCSTSKKLTNYSSQDVQAFLFVPIQLLMGVYFPIENNKNHTTTNSIITTNNNPSFSNRKFKSTTFRRGIYR